MRLLLAVMSLALVPAAISCSGDSGPDLKPLAVEICGESRSLSPGAAADLLVHGMEVALDSGATIEQYSDALAAQCPRTIERFLGTESYRDWMRD